MRERTGQILKSVCLVLAALLLYRLVQTTLRINPLAHVAIPALPLLDSDTNAPAAGGKPTNSVSVMTKGTNASPNVLGTNSDAANKLKEVGTNFAAGVSTNLSATNIVGPLTPALSPSAGARESVVARIDKASDLTNSAAQEAPPTANSTETNSIAVFSPADAATTNTPSLSATNLLPTTSSAVTNLALAAPSGGTNLTSTETNLSLTVAAAGTNVAGTNSLSAKVKGTNSPSSKTSVAGINPNPAPMRGGGGRPGAGELPPEIKARVDRIYESEIFGQIMRPQPMALQGIAGNSAFLRSPGGQTGLVKEGDSLGEIKLLKIGINRVLVEQDGKKSELTIFEGYGSESLMPKDPETSTNKTISK